METILTEGLISFKDLEQKIYKFVCELGCEITQIMLESYDKELAAERNTSIYRDKGKRTTCIKTVYGEVSYSRRVYKTVNDNGQNAYIYLLDEAMKMDKIGFLSTNLIEKIAFTVAESPYRVTAETISKTCGQSISAQGVWNAIQKLGAKISEEEEYAVKQMNADESEGKKIIPILFEEMDGVWLRMRDENHKKIKKQEMKVATMYEGWDEEKESENRSTLVGKTMLAGMEDSKDFHEKREAQIRKIYDADEIKQRVLNGDGGSWIKDPYDPDAIFQLDRYHIYQEILRKIKDKKAQQEIRKRFEEEKIDEMFEYIKNYATSVESPDENDKRSENARELLTYLSNNRNGLLPYDKHGIEIPKPEEGIVYKHMGVQENENCTVITKRMKHRRMSWSRSGANNLAKVLYKRENKDLINVIERYTDGFIFTMKMKSVVEVLSAAKAPKKDGKGNPYADIVNKHLPLIDAMQTASRKAFRKAFL